MKKIHDFCQQFFCLIFPCNIVKCNSCRRLNIYFGIAFSKLHKWISGSTSPHLFHQTLCKELSQYPENHDWQNPYKQETDKRIHLFLCNSSKFTSGFFQPVYKIRVFKRRCLIVIRLSRFIRKINRIAI